LEKGKKFLKSVKKSLAITNYNSQPVRFRAFVVVRGLVSHHATFCSSRNLATTLISFRTCPLLLLHLRRIFTVFGVCFFCSPLPLFSHPFCSTVPEMAGIATGLKKGHIVTKRAKAAAPKVRLSLCSCSKSFRKIEITRIL
jgi:hypothetical protein